MNVHPNPMPDPPGPTRLGRTEDIRRGVLLGIAVLALLLPPHPLAPQQGPAVASAASGQPPRLLNNLLEDLDAAAASDDTRLLTHWVVETGDNAGLAFIVIDKKAAQLYLFDAAARLSASTPVLLGSAQGDDTVPGIGLRPVEDVRPEERTTPAGRFLGIRGRNHTGEDVVWVDHDAAVSMHRVRTTQPRERRLQRLASPSVADKRISYGCINVPAAFFDAHIAPTFATRRAVIYVLPEQKTLQQVFGAHPRLMPPSPRAHWRPTPGGPGRPGHSDGAPQRSLIRYRSIHGRSQAPRSPWASRANTFRRDGTHMLNVIARAHLRPLRSTGWPRPQKARDRPRKRTPGQRASARAWGGDRVSRHHGWPPFD